MNRLSRPASSVLDEFRELTYATLPNEVHAHVEAALVVATTMRELAGELRALRLELAAHRRHDTNGTQQAGEPAGRRHRT
jgi:hypothetical protein